MQNFSINYCQSCQSRNFVESLEPETSIHYGRVTCGDCQRFIKWLPKPKVAEISIIRLLQSAKHLNSWEVKFLKTVVYRNPTNAESIVIQAIQEKINSVSERSTG